MPVTRRAAAGHASPPPRAASRPKGKRAAETQTSKSAKRSKTRESTKEQKTIEETMDGGQTTEESMDRDAKNGTQEKHEIDQNGTDNKKSVESSNAAKEKKETAFDDVKADESEVKATTNEEHTRESDEITNGKDSVIKDERRETAVPSSFLEKGIIYFFFRSRVNIDEPQGVTDIARSYIVLRPLPIGAKLSDGPLEDAGNARLLALPKKILPKSARDRFLVFVEKQGVSVKDLKDNFIAGNEYSTKTAGTRHTPDATPIAEGVYAITSSGRESHLAYHVTIPEALGEVQKDMGINKQGSYVVSVKNPTTSAPSNVSLPKGAEYPEVIMQKFRGLRWIPLEPELLDYDNSQILIIGEGMGNVEKAMVEQEGDAQDDTKETPAEEMEKLEDEDQIRVEHLKGKDAVFADLGLSSKDYPKMQTTW